MSFTEPPGKTRKYRVLAARLLIGSTVRMLPLMERRVLVAALKDSMIDPVAEPDRSVMSPVPLAMASLKVRERLEATATPVAPSAGEKERTVGAVVSAKAVRKS